LQKPLGVGSLVLGGLIDLVNFYPASKSSVEALKAAGGTGGLMADVFLSPLFGLALIVLGLVWVATAKPGNLSNQRIFVSRPPLEIMALYRGRTTHQADKLFQDYKGKWLKLRGVVDDVSAHGTGSCISLGIEDPGVHVMLWFDRQSQGTISHLNVRDEIEAEGQIDGATAHTLVFRKCVLLTETAISTHER
jgi:hypothetical protein